MTIFYFKNNSLFYFNINKPVTDCNSISNMLSFDLIAFFQGVVITFDMGYYFLIKESDINHILQCIKEIGNITRGNFTLG